MGILDDAIRQHLELKRQRGATESELEQLEHEAFGPPSRPGEPDFPASEESHGQSGNGAAAEPSAEGEGAMVREEEPETQAPESAPGSEEETAIFDHSQADPKLQELDLDVEPTEAPVEEQAEEPPIEAEDGPAPEEPSGSAPPDAPVESLDTVEHPLPDAEPEAPPQEEAGPEPGPEPSEEPEEEGVDEEEAEGDEEDDVLADTPEFLKDAPEDDELWFEQGKPKDFDF